VTKLRILLTEDHETVREGLRLIVNAQSDMEVVGEAGDGGRPSPAAELLPDIVVMDVSMPKLNGLKATEKLKEVCPQVKVLTLTRHTDSGYLQQILRAGASGYVLKQARPPNCSMRSAPLRRRQIPRPAVAGKVIGNYAGKHSAALRRTAESARRSLTAKRKFCVSSPGGTATKRSPRGST
jgi:DNA-binding NarL/FixJ family response regulator